MREYAVLSASSSHRWLSVPPIARLEELFENKTSDAAEEGTVAHSLAEWKLKKELGYDEKRPDSSRIDKDMEYYTDSYISYVLDQIKDHSEVLVEQRLDFSTYVPEGFGTGDCIIVSENRLQIIDFKYGKGVEVVAKDNPQMKLYALGALALFDVLYDIEDITMTIFQPRKNNISSWAIATEELLDWAETILKPQAELAFKGEGTITYGPWFQFSNCGVVLRARHNYHKKLVDYQLPSPHQLTDVEIEDVLTHVDDLVKWATEVKDYAIQVAKKTGKTWKGFRLAHGRSNRKFTDTDAVIEVAVANGYDNIYKKQLLSLTEIEKLMGKKTFKELLGEYVEKPEGKLTLVKDQSLEEDFGGK
ncbi:DUF2800 domain-containing protein [Streptococcus acidominimus]|uniref:Nuclease n=1 Tax=Streptococcus acidominimus TaxID=1326 RepID=A0A1Q8EBG8_STRAI|nr:DUF2800 domain-containing protein [Streptococcus acidominimus]OLF49130.1 nuclease [Streptococcus acidominimus]SUN06840.1 phage protein [Streptococcus acidominimus]